jgi:molecular chaperone GrpE
MLQDVLRDENVSEIQALDAPFDPYLHHALQCTPSAKPKNTIIDVVQKGYMYHNRVLRPSIVILSAGDENHE